MSAFSEFIQTLKTKSNIVEVIGSYISLDKRGYNHWACCPFHHEKTPSFSVSEDGFYHCFGCGVSGDVINFVKEYENIDFMQAVQILAKRAGLEVPVFDDKENNRTDELKKKRDRHLAVMHAAARYYLNNLYSEGAEQHREYLAGRKLQPTTVKKFGLGASLDYSSLPRFLIGKGFSPEEIVECGACVRTPEGRIIDAQGERLIIPIINSMDEVIAFGGRVMKPTERAKYKNTRETLLFNKSKNLFNINLIKKQKRAGGLSSIIMVEGYMDAISLWQAGFYNVVASMGTSLTKEQARLCKRYADNVLISYDGDFAGQKANLRGLDILKDEGLRVRVVPMPEGLDPDDVIKTQGKEGYQKCLDNSMPLIDFRIHATQLKYDMSRTDERREFVKEALVIVREAESATEREELLKNIARQAEVSYSALLRDLERLPKAEEKPSATQPPKEDNADREIRAARFVLAACLLSKRYAEQVDLNAIDFDVAEHRLIARYIMQGRENGKVRPGGLFEIFDANDPELSEILNLDFGSNLDGQQAERYFNDCVKTLNRKTLRRAVEKARAACQDARTSEERRQALALLNQLTIKLRNS